MRFRLKQQSGQSSIGYGLLVGLIAVVILGSIQLTGNNLDRIFGNVGNNIEEVIADREADPLGILPIENAFPNGTQFSSVATVEGVNRDVSLTVDPAITLWLNGAEQQGQTISVTEGDQLQFQAQAPTAYSDTLELSYQLGEQTEIWSIATASSYQLPTVAQATPKTVYRSTPTPITGFVGTVTLTALSGEGQPQLYLNDVLVESFPVEISESDLVAFEAESGEGDGTTRTIQALVENVIVSWDLITEDSSPIAVIDELNPARLNVEVQSNEIIVTDFDVPLPISVSEGFYQIGEGDRTDQPSVLEPGQTVQLFTMTVDTENTEQFVDLVIGDTTFKWRIVTGDETPDDLIVVGGDSEGGDLALGSFEIPASEVLTPNTELQTGRIRPIGFTVPIFVSISGGNNAEFKTDTGSWGTEPVLLEVGQYLEFKQVTGEADGSLSRLDIQFGRQAGGWSVVAHDITPDPVIFADTSGHIPGEWAESDSVVVTGYTGVTRVDAIDRVDTPSDPTAPSNNVQISVNGGGWTNYALLPPEATLRVRQFIPSTAGYLEDYTASIKLGAMNGEEGITATWKGTSAGYDDLPDPFTIPAIVGADPFIEVISSEVFLTGFDREAEIDVSGDATVKISIDDGPYVETSGTKIRENQKFRISVISRDYGETVNISVKAGNLSGDYSATVWSVTSRELDLEPELSYIIPNITSPQGYKATVDSEIVVPTGFSDPLDIKITGTHAAYTKVRLNGGSWVSPDGSGYAGQLLPGQSMQLQQYIELATGTAKTVTVQVGDAPSYTWSVATLDMYPNAITAIPTQTRGPATPGWIVYSNGTRWTHQLSGLGTNVGIPVGSIGSNPMYVNGSNYPSAYVNGHVLQEYVSAPSSPNATLVYTYDFGGRIVTATIHSTATPRNPRRYVFDDIDDAAQNERSISDWIVPYQYGAPMNVSILPSGSFSSSNNCTTATALLEVKRGETIISTGASVTITEGDAIRVSIDQGTVASKSVCVEYNYSRETVWTTALNPAADKKPNPFYVQGNSTTANYNVTQISPWVYDKSTNNHLTGFSGPIYATVKQISGPTDAFYALQRWEDYASFGPRSSEAVMQVNPKQLFRFYQSGTRTPNATYVYEITAGHPTDSSQQEKARYTIYTNPADIDPDPVSITAGPTLAAGNSYVESIPVSVVGFEAPVPISISGDPSAEMSISGGSWRSTDSKISSAATLKVRLLTGPSTGTTKSLTVKIHGTKSDGSANVQTIPWSVTTMDDQPNSFGFSSLSNAEPNIWVKTNLITISGINVPIRLTATGLGRPLIEVNENGLRVSTVEVKNGDTVRLWNFLDAGYNTVYNTTLQVGSSVTEQWQVRTRTQDSIPDPFSWPSTSGVTPSESVTSTGLEPSGFLDEADVVIVDNAGGSLEVSLNGGAYSSATSVGSVIPGQPIRLRMTAPEAGQSRTAQVSVGGVVGSWTVQSAAN